MDDEWYLGFVNKVSDSAAKLLVSRYKHEQLAYFKSVVRIKPYSFEVLRCEISVELLVSHRKHEQLGYRSFVRCKASDLRRRVSNLTI